jgi:hypothetical protein
MDSVGTAIYTIRFSDKIDKLMGDLLNIEIRFRRAAVAQRAYG